MREMNRAAHFDFHTMPGITGFGREFDAADFARTMQEANIAYVNVFARCNIGFSYYNTRIGTPYKGMKGSMLEDLIRECHRLNIGVTAYINGGLNHELCLKHPEYMKVSRQGEVMSGDRVNNNFFRSMCFNTGYRQHLLAEIREVLELEPDGIFMDCLIPKSCYCPRCTRKMREQGIDITNEEQVFAFAYETYLDVMREIRALVPRDKRLYLNSFNYEVIADMQSHVELECLASGFWGYDFFGVQAPYFRNFTEDRIYMTGRFVGDWGDFGGIRTKESLENDVYDALLYGYGVSIGDHMHPHGTISKALYKDVGEIFGFVKELERWTKGARPICDVCVLRNKTTPKTHFAKPDDSERGVCRMLSELKICYEVMDEDMDFSKFRLLVLPDEIEISEKLHKKLIDFKGAVLSSGKSFRADSELWDFVEFVGEDTHSDAYYDLGDGETRSFYEPSWLVKSEDSIASYIEPYFDKIWDGEHGYFYTPPKGGNGLCAVAKKGSRAYICFAVFKSYFKKEAKFHKDLVKMLIDSLLPQKVLQADELPSSARAALFEGNEGTLLMVKTTYPELRGMRGIVEEHNWLPGGRRVRVCGEYRAACTLPDEEELAVTVQDGYTELVLPEICGFQAFLLRR
ncbi:MAG: hypothetical protein J6B85_09195 [Lachnospiraceae bacterium]|nr:hypothetical protein [Lachnospiraceae bacterium]